MNNSTSSVLIKRCSKCGEEKPHSLFYTNTARRDGLSVYCRPCMNESNKRYNKSLKHKPDNDIPLTKKCFSCCVVKSSVQFSKNKGSKDGLYSFCKDCVKAKSQKWKLKNASHHQEYNRRYRGTVKGKTVAVIATAKYRSLKRKLPSTFTRSDWEHALSYFGYFCAYCGSQQGLWNPMCMEHFTPVTLGGTFTSINIVPACKSCNSSKGNNDTVEWLNGKFGKRKAKEILNRINNYFESVK